MPPFMYPQMPQFQMPQMPMGYPQQMPQMQMPQMPQMQPHQPNSATTVEITGPIVQFANGSPRIGDAKLDQLPAGINFAVAVGQNGEYLRTMTTWKGLAHVSSRGRVWVTDIVNTGAPAPAAASDINNGVQFAQLLAQAKGAKAPAAPSEDAPAM